MEKKSHTIKPNKKPCKRRKKISFSPPLVSGAKKIKQTIRFEQMSKKCIYSSTVRVMLKRFLCPEDE
jgi:hypothetical protein